MQPNIISIRKYEYDQILTEVRTNRILIDKIKKYTMWHMRRGGLPTFKSISNKFGITYKKLLELIEYEEDLDKVVGATLNKQLHKYKTIDGYQVIILD